MVTTEQEAPGRATVAQRWLARLALVAAAAAVLVPLLVAGLRQSVALGRCTNTTPRRRGGRT